MLRINDNNGRKKVTWWFSFSFLWWSFLSTLFLQANTKICKLIMCNSQLIVLNLTKWSKCRNHQCHYAQMKTLPVFFKQICEKMRGAIDRLKFRRQFEIALSSLNILSRFFHPLARGEQTGICSTWNSDLPLSNLWLMPEPYCWAENRIVKMADVQRKDDGFGIPES